MAPGRAALLRQAARILRDDALAFELGALPEPVLPVLKQAWGIVVAARPARTATRPCLCPSS